MLGPATDSFKGSSARYNNFNNDVGVWGGGSYSSTDFCLQETR